MAKTKKLSEQSKQRLLALADYMERVKPSKFALDSYFATPHKSDEKTAKKLLKNLIPLPAKKHAYEDEKRFAVPEGFCNTSACVLGHAALNEDFVKDGLFVRALVFTPTDVEEARPADLPDASFDVVYKKGKLEYVGAMAGAKFFGIPEKHATHLFGYGTYAQNMLFNDGKSSDEPTPKGVAKGLRKYVETDGQELEKYFNVY